MGMSSMRCNSILLLLTYSQEVQLVTGHVLTLQPLQQWHLGTATCAIYS